MSVYRVPDGAGGFVYTDEGFGLSTDPEAREGVWLPVELFTHIALIKEAAMALEVATGGIIQADARGIASPEGVELRERLIAYRVYGARPDAILEATPDAWEEETSDHEPVPPADRYIVRRVGKWYEVFDTAHDPDDPAEGIWAKRRTELAALDDAGRLNHGKNYRPIS